MIYTYDVYPDAMLPNDNYYKYFDIKTGLPKETEKEESLFHSLKE